MVVQHGDEYHYAESVKNNSKSQQKIWKQRWETTKPGWKPMETHEFDPLRKFHLWGSQSVPVSFRPGGLTQPNPTFFRQVANGAGHKNEHATPDSQGM